MNCFRLWIHFPQWKTLRENLRSRPLKPRSRSKIKKLIKILTFIFISICKHCLDSYPDPINRPKKLGIYKYFSFSHLSERSDLRVERNWISINSQGGESVNLSHVSGMHVFISLARGICCETKSYSINEIPRKFTPRKVVFVIDLENISKPVKVAIVTRQSLMRNFHDACFSCMR